MQRLALLLIGFYLVCNDLKVFGVVFRKKESHVDMSFLLTLKLLIESL